MNTVKITISYRAVDNYHERRKFKTLKGAQRFAQKCVGRTPELGHCYAVSADGVGTIYAFGVDLRELFPEVA